MAEVFQLRIALHENIVKPTIWRMVQMEADRSLLDLHLLIQAAMGWENGHLYAFYEPGSHTGYTDMLLMEGDPDFEDGAKVKLRDVLKKVGNKLIYEYDFGDSWQHTVRLQSVLPMPLGFQAGCTDGARNC
ncbi:MAG: plasmid pRiA4b ORF-3 family protein, partial [Runella slithyformis]